MPIRRQLPVRPLLYIFFVGVVLILSACGPELPATTLTPQGSHAQRIYDLMIPIFWAALAVFVVVEGLLVYSVVRFRRRADSSIPAQVHGNTRIEILWTVTPALILLVIAVLTFRTQAENSVQPASAMQITAVGHQWWFEFQYPGLGENGAPLITANDMYIPVGQDVTISLKSNDVIHSFWIPKLAGKTDMIPSKTNLMSFRAEQPGIYRGQCAEFCGEEHALMRFRVIAVPAATFQGWVSQQNTAPPAPAGDAMRGQQIFLSPAKACIGCHTVSGTAAKGILGPNLTYFGNRETIAAGTLPNTPENLTTWLHNPGAVKPGNIMSTVIKQGSLSDQEVADLVAYLEGMKFSIEKPEHN